MSRFFTEGDTRAYAKALGWDLTRQPNNPEGFLYRLTNTDGEYKRDEQPAWNEYRSFSDAITDLLDVHAKDSRFGNVQFADKVIPKDFARLGIVHPAEFNLLRANKDYMIHDVLHKYDMGTFVGYNLEPDHVGVILIVVGTYKMAYCYYREGQWAEPQVKELYL